jgi:hypothetical protein
MEKFAMDSAGDLAPELKSNETISRIPKEKRLI